MQLGEVIGLVGGSIAIIKSIFEGIQWFRNQSRVEFHILRIQRYIQRYNEYEFKTNYNKPSPDYDASFLLDKLKEEFIIIELEIYNPQNKPITIRKIEIDDWIFDECYIGGMYAPKHDYRVYDLYTRERVSLAANIQVNPAETIGRRIEIVEHTEGPGWVSSKSRYQLPERLQMQLRFYAGTRLVKKTVKTPASEKDYYWSFGIARWSGNELITVPTDSSGGQPRP